MKLDVVLLSCNDNPEYYLFYPYVKEIWEKVLNCKCILLYVGINIPNELIKYKDDIILFKPLENVHTAFIAQTVRLLYPCIMNNYDNGIMVGDIDSIPMNREYFLDKIKDVDNTKLIYYSHDPKIQSVKEHNMSFNVATSNVWAEIFSINSIDDIYNRLREWSNENKNYHYDGKYRSKCVGYHYDQQVFYRYMMNWKNRETNMIVYNLSERRRFKPCTINENIIDNIRNGFYDDNIFLRPYHRMRKNNELIKQILLSKYK